MCQVRFLHHFWSCYFNCSINGGDSVPYKKEINISFGMRVRKERERQKMTREVFAEKINVSTRFIADVKSGLVGV